MCESLVLCAGSETPVRGKRRVGETSRSRQGEKREAGVVVGKKGWETRRGRRKGKQLGV